MFLSSVYISRLGRVRHGVFHDPSVLDHQLDMVAAAQDPDVLVRFSVYQQHIRQLAGENTHHVIEGMFKAVARAMRQACEPDPRMGDALPSTKGML